MQTDILHNKYFLHIQNLRISESFNPDHYLGPEYRWSYYTRSAVFPLLIGWGDIITEVLLYCLTITSAYHWLWQRADCADATWRSVVVVNVHQVIGRLVCGVGGERPSGNIVCWGEGVRGLWDRAVVCTVSHRTETCGISRYRHCIYYDCHRTWSRRIPHCRLHLSVLTGYIKMWFGAALAVHSVEEESVWRDTRVMRGSRGPLKTAVLIVS